MSAQLNIFTSDPVRPQFTVFLLGNGESALNCTPPSVEVVSPVEASFYHQWQDLVVTARVFDQEQPPDSLYVELFLGGLLIEDEFPDENGFVTFVIDIDDHSPSIPTGLQPLSLRVTDGCQLWGFDSFVAAVDFPLSTQDVDGDGFDPNQGDCDENNPEIVPQAVEELDGYDNNCNGLKDERDGCIEIDAAPMILGEIQMGATAIGQGESTVMTIEVYDPDGAEFDFAWQEDDQLAAQGHSGFDSIATQTVTWTAPQVSDTSTGEVYTLYVVVSDPEGHSDWAFGEITVMPDTVDGTIGGYDASEDDDSGGCGKDDEEEGASSAALFVPLLILLGWRRREE